MGLIRMMLRGALFVVAGLTFFVMLAGDVDAAATPLETECTESIEFETDDNRSPSGDPAALEAGGTTPRCALQLASGLDTAILAFPGTGILCGFCRRLI